MTLSGTKKSFPHYKTKLLTKIFPRAKEIASELVVQKVGISEDRKRVLIYIRELYGIVVNFLKGYVFGSAVWLELFGGGYLPGEDFTKPPPNDIPDKLTSDIDVFFTSEKHIEALIKCLSAIDGLTVEIAKIKKKNPDISSDYGTTVIHIYFSGIQNTFFLKVDISAGSLVNFVAQNDIFENKLVLYKNFWPQYLNYPPKSNKRMDPSMFRDIVRTKNIPVSPANTEDLYDDNGRKFDRVDDKGVRIGGFNPLKIKQFFERYLKYLEKGFTFYRPKDCIKTKRSPTTVISTIDTVEKSLTVHQKDNFDGKDEKCIVCLASFKDFVKIKGKQLAVITSCSHFMCHNCYGDYIERNMNENVIKCPTCRKFLR